MKLIAFFNETKNIMRFHLHQSAFFNETTSQIKAVFRRHQMSLFGSNHFQ